MVAGMRGGWVVVGKRSVSWWLCSEDVKPPPERQCASSTAMMASRSFMSCSRVEPGKKSFSGVA